MEYEFPGITVLLFLYPRPPPPDLPPPIASIETLVTPAGATHEKVPSLV
jgi:hypothetical protein